MTFDVDGTTPEGRFNRGVEDLIVLRNRASLSSDWFTQVHDALDMTTFALLEIEGRQRPISN